MNEKTVAPYLNDLPARRVYNSLPVSNTMSFECWREDHQDCNGHRCEWLDMAGKGWDYEICQCPCHYKDGKRIRGNA